VQRDHSLGIEETEQDSEAEEVIVFPASSGIFGGVLRANTLGSARANDGGQYPKLKRSRPVICAVARVPTTRSNPRPAIGSPPTKGEGARDRRTRRRSCFEESASYRARQRLRIWSESCRPVDPARLPREAASPAVDCHIRLISLYRCRTETLSPLWSCSARAYAVSATNSECATCWHVLQRGLVRDGVIPSTAPALVRPEEDGRLRKGVVQDLESLHKGLDESQIPYEQLAHEKEQVAMDQLDLAAARVPLVVAGREGHHPILHVHVPLLVRRGVAMPYGEQLGDASGLAARQMHEQQQQRAEGGHCTQIGPHTRRRRGSRARSGQKIVRRAAVCCESCHGGLEEIEKTSGCESKRGDG